MKRTILWLVFAIAMFAFGASQNRAAQEGRGGSLASRLLGPVRGVASSVQWIRFDIARRDGDFDLAYSRAETALSLNPDAVAGWMLLGRHLTFDRGAPGGGSNLEERLVWLEAGLEILERGKAFVAHPEELDLAQATFMAAQASYAPEDCVWPGGPKACFEAAAEHFRAAGLDDLAQSALELAAETE